MNLSKRLSDIDWSAHGDALDSQGYAVVSSLLPVTTCETLAADYENPQINYRATIAMSRYNFGQGEYKYFAYPLPSFVSELRARLYPPLADIANKWAIDLGDKTRWPETVDKLTAQCHQAGQMRPTPLILNYEQGGYNCLHQDLYGEIYFPLQVVVLLSDPRKDFSGGELILVEQRPRMQSRAMVIPLQQGDAAIIPVRERPKRGKNRLHRVQMRHGVSELRSGKRRTLGVIFHDAT